MMCRLSWYWKDGNTIEFLHAKNSAFKLSLIKEKLKSIKNRLKIENFFKFHFITIFAWIKKFNFYQKLRMHVERLILISKLYANILFSIFHEVIRLKLLVYLPLSQIICLVLIAFSIMGQFCKNPGITNTNILSNPFRIPK